MELNYLHLFYFWKAAEQGSFSRASKELKVAQSTVSLQIQALEKALGHRLIERGPRKFELTNHGSLAKSRCDEIFSRGKTLLKELERGTQQQPAYHIGIENGLRSSLALDLLDPQKLAKGRPFQIETFSQSELLSRLNDRKLDAGVSSSRPSQNSGRSLKVKLLARLSLVLSAHTQRRPEKIPTVLIPAAHTLYQDQIEKDLKHAQIQIVPNEDWALDLLRRGQGSFALLLQNSALKSPRQGPSYKTTQFYLLTRI